ncbi:MAG: hypothetical protein ACJA2X_000330 [Halocynthiibacter sp.]|jgi:hypothetical protein
MHSLQFKKTTASKDDECFMVAFGDAVDGSESYVILQVAKEFDEQDCKLGMGGIYFEINDQAHSGYNVVDRIEVAEQVITIEFSTQPMGLSDDQSPIRILTLVAQKTMAEVCDMLKLIATNSNVNFIENNS